MVYKTQNLTGFRIFIICDKVIHSVMMMIRANADTIQDTLQNTHAYTDKIVRHEMVLADRNGEQYRFYRRLLMDNNLNFSVS